MRLAYATAAIVFLGLCALPAMAQENLPADSATNPTVGAPVKMAAPVKAVTNGNTTIIFAPANSNDIDRDQLRTWGEFATAHPQIARHLAYRPALIDDSGYLKKHPELASFFDDNPNIKEAMNANPGNFVAIPPRPGE